MSLTDTLIRTEPRWASSHLHYCWVDRGKIILKRTTIDEKDVGRSLSLALTSSKMPHPACGLRMPTPNSSGWRRLPKAWENW